MRLVGVELTRLRWRRAIVVLLAGCLLVPALVWAGLAWNTRPVSDADLERAQQEVADYEVMMREEESRCLENPREYGIPRGEDPERLCREFTGSEEPQVEWFLYRPQLDLGDEREGTGLAVITILAALVMLIGTTFAGHDWNSGSMGNQLLFEPRRLRVWAAKAGAVVVTGVVTAVVVLTAYWGALWLLAEARDVPASGAEWELIRNSVLRGIGLVAAAGLGGYALTMFFRSTVATLGIMFGFAVAGSLVIVAVLGEAATRWLLPTNVAAYLLNGFEYYDPSVVCEDPFGGCDQTTTLSLASGTLYLGVVLVVVVALSLWSFRRRDVP